MVPEDAANLSIPPEGIPGLHIATRDEGVLVTTDLDLAVMFDHEYSEPVMAQILGYPEDKLLTGERCPHPISHRARAVQARDAEGHVITEAFCSPAAFFETYAAVARHVPSDGDLIVMLPVAAIARRVAMRWIGF